MGGKDSVRQVLQTKAISFRRFLIQEGHFLASHSLYSLRSNRMKQTNVGDDPIVK
jgi:CRISPR/Cas system-associated protein endoribonuclease Cas2